MTAESNHDSLQLESLHSGEVGQTPECQVSRSSTEMFAHCHHVLRLLEDLAELQVPDVGSDPPHLLQPELLHLAVQLVPGAGSVHQDQLDSLWAGEGPAQPVGERGPPGAKLHEGEVARLQQTCLGQVSHQRAVLDVVLQNSGTWGRPGVLNKLILGGLPTIVFVGQFFLQHLVLKMLLLNGICNESIESLPYLL